MAENDRIEKYFLKKEIEKLKQELAKKREDLTYYECKLRSNIYKAEEEKINMLDARLDEVKAECKKKISQLIDSKKKTLEEIEKALKEDVAAIFVEQVDELTEQFRITLEDVTAFINEFKYLIVDKEKHIEYLKEKLLQFSIREEEMARDRNSPNLERTRILLNEENDKRDLLLESWKSEAIQINKKKENLCTALKKIYDEYKRMRKVALFYKTLIENRDKSLKYEKTNKLESLMEIEREINEAVKRERLNDAVYFDDEDDEEADFGRLKRTDRQCDLRVIGREIVPHFWDRKN